MTAFHILLAGYYLLIGSFSSSKDEGILVYDFDADTGQASYVSGLSGINGPSFLCAAPFASPAAAKGTDYRVYAVAVCFPEIFAGFLQFVVVEYGVEGEIDLCPKLVGIGTQ